MKIMNRFKRYRGLAVIATVLIIMGCSSSDDFGEDEDSGSCTDAFKPSNALNKTFPTFRLEQDATNPAGGQLDRALFRPFLKAAVPAQDAPDRARELYRFIVSETDAFAEFNDGFAAEPLVIPEGGDMAGFTSVRNRFDLLEAMIVSASDASNPLQNARDAMASCSRNTRDALEADEEGIQGGRIQVNSITVEETGPGDDEPITWRMAVTYNHNPNPFNNFLGPNIARLITTPSVAVFSLYDFDKFMGAGATSGFKQPDALTAIMNSDGLSTGLDDSELSTDLDDSKTPSILFESFPNPDATDNNGKARGSTDRWEWSLEDGTDEFRFSGGGNASCIRAEVDYSAAENQVSVALSANPCPSISEREGDSEDEDAENTFEPVETLTYTSANPDTPQTRD